MLLRTTLIPNSFVQGHRLLRSTFVNCKPESFQFNIAYSANHSSCRNCLRRCCTLSGAVHRTVRFRMEKADAMTFCSQLDLQTSTWFDHSAEDSSRTVSYLVRRLRSALRSSSSLQLHVQSSSLIQQLRNINRRSATISICRRTLFYTRPRQFAHLQVHQQCRTPSTRQVVTTQPFPEFNNVELHRRRNGASSQQCRTPSTSRIAITIVPPVINVELHRLSELTRSVFSLGIAVELRQGELSSCAKHTLNTCNLTSTRPSAASDSKKK